jgi:hypothetical protein
VLSFANPVDGSAVVIGVRPPEGVLQVFESGTGSLIADEVRTLSAAQFTEIGNFPSVDYVIEQTVTQTVINPSPAEVALFGTAASDVLRLGPTVDFLMQVLPGEAVSILAENWVLTTSQFYWVGQNLRIEAGFTNGDDDFDTDLIKFPSFIADFDPNTANIGLDGMGGNDLMSLGNLGDRAAGGSGNDTLNGDAGSDTLRGDEGLDLLTGGSGGDVLTGGDGNDVLRGGAGADRFAFATGTGADRIQDFADDVDTLVLNKSLWGGDTLRIAQVLSRFAVDTGADVELRFSVDDVVTLRGLADISMLQNDILIR